MRMMCSNWTKIYTFPLAIRACSKPRCFNSFSSSKPQFSRLGFYAKPSLNPESSLSARPICCSIEFQLGIRRLESVAKPRSMLSGFNMSVSSVRGRHFSSSSFERVSEDSGLTRGSNDLPWLASGNAKKVKVLDRAMADTGRSSWELSADRLMKVGEDGSPVEEPAKRLNKATIRSYREESGKKGFGRNGRFKVEDRGNRNGIYKLGNRENRHRVSMEENKGGGSKNRVSSAEERENRNRMLHVEKDWRRDHIGRDESTEEESVEETEVVDDPRWDTIKNRFGRVGDVRGRNDVPKPELRRWNKQEDWGKKTWKEATESTLPLIIGEGVYGVGPVLAALSAGRREFYALYVQEGLDLSSNNRKKKDKKGFENVLRMAEKLGLSVKNIPKHDLNMIADNRPHQGIVLDSSPLEMVKIQELDPVSEDDQGSLWVALDEVTDPQNLGAIIRSAYFFGASGVVLCAKNSAPLSGVVSKASAGSLELMELRYCKNMMQFLTGSAENGWRVLGGSVSANSVPVREVLPGAPTVLVLGNEGTGLRPLVERSCTQLIKIPGNIPVDITAGREAEDVEAEHKGSGEEFRSFMAVESLNVSVATGVLLHHFIGNSSAQAG